MSVNIFYNNQDFFSDNDLPTPHVSRSTSNIIFGESVGLKELVNLSGQIYLDEPPSDCDYLTELNQKREDLINFFSEDFKELKIIEDSTIIFRKDFSKILNINFPESSYSKILQYSIDLECYDESIHNEFFGVQDIENKTSIAKGEDEVYSISRTISAKGINLQTESDSITGNNVSSSSSSLQNAIDFVNNLSGEENVLLPENNESIQLHLISKNENIDRIRNTYSISEEYIADKNDTNENHGILRYTTDKSEPFGSVQEISISGTLKFGKNYDFELAKNRFKEIDFFEEITDKLNVSDFVEQPRTITISEREEERLINFSLTYDNDTTYDNCGVSTIMNFQINQIGEKVDLNVSGEIKARGVKSKRWDLVKEKFYNQTYDSTKYSSWINEAAQDHLDEHYIDLDLYKFPEAKSVKEDKKNGIISFEYQFTNREKIEDFKNFECSVDVVLPAPKYSVDMNFGGSMDSYIISRSGFKKGSVTVTSNGSYKNFTGVEEDDRDQAFSSMQTKNSEKFSETQTKFFSTYEYRVISLRKSYSKNNNRAQMTETREYFKNIV